MNIRSQGRQILVTGATGNIGGAVVSQFHSAGIPVRALVRRPESAHLPKRVEVVRGDLTDANTLDAALDGIDTVFLVWRLLPLETAPAMLEAFAKHARRIVLLSSAAVIGGVNPKMASITDHHVAMERLIENSGMEWTFLRPGGFAITTLSWWAPQIRSGDVVRWPYGDAASSPIHEHDIAAVAVRALTEEGHEGAKYHLTGPQSLTQAQEVRAIGEAIGRPLRFEEIDPETARSEMLASLPPPIVDVLLNVWPSRIHAPAPVTDTVAQVTESPALTYQEWAKDHAADFQRSN